MIPNLTMPTFWTVVLACAPILVAGCGGATNGPTPPADDDTAEPSLVVHPRSGAPGTEVRLEARNLPPRQSVGVGAGPPASEYNVYEHRTTDADGSLDVTVPVPAWAEVGDSVVFAVDVPGPGGAVLAEPFRVEGDESDSPADDEIEITGTLTDEGVECPAVRGDDGQLYTLAGGDLEGFSTGDRLRIRGTVAQMSFCMQGTTIAVRSLDSED